jgi:hypothetical protein
MRHCDEGEVNLQEEGTVHGAGQETRSEGEMPHYAEKKSCLEEEGTVPDAERTSRSSGGATPRSMEATAKQHGPKDNNVDCFLE